MYLVGIGQWKTHSLNFCMEFCGADFKLNTFTINWLNIKLLFYFPLIFFVDKRQDNNK